MRELIERRIEEWTRGLEELQAQRGKAAQQLSELDVAIQRNIGAITGAKDLLALEEAAEVEPPTE